MEPEAALLKNANMNRPKISVLMSVYNGQIYLREAIDSILGQTFKDFEFLIIDDGSTDRSVEIIRSYLDPRIRFYQNENNIGLTRSLNKGLRFAKGDYVARIDADDLSLPDRLGKQKLFLEKKPQVAMVGSWVGIIDESGNTQDIWRTLTDSNLLRWRLLFKNSFAHCAVMFRKDVALQIGGYDQAFKYSQDYDLWSRIGFQWEVANIPQVFVKWRRWGKNITATKEKKQEEIARMVSRRNLKCVLGEPINNATFEAFRLLYYPSSDTFDLNKVNILTSSIGMLGNLFLRKFGYRDGVISRRLRAEIANQFLCLLEANAFKTRYKVIPLLHWLLRFDPTISKHILLRILVKSLVGEHICKTGRNLLQYTSLWKELQSLA